MTAAAKRGWGESFLVYRHPRVIGMLFLGFSAGLPFLLVFSTLSAWLREEQITRTTIGFFSWVGVMYSIKVFWAPVVDRLRLPWLTRLMGRRRSWMLLAMFGIACGLIGMALTDVHRNLAHMALFALLVAFSSATQDVAMDAYRIEAVDRDLQGAMSGTYQMGYRIAVLCAGGGALYLADFLSWTVAYVVMAVLMTVGVVTVLIIREPAVPTDAAVHEQEERVISFLARSEHLPGWLRTACAWFIGAVVCPFVDFFSRNRAMAFVILVFIAIFRISDYTMGVMANPFYIDLGFTKSEIASVIKVYGFVMTILGALAGGVLVARYGILRPLLASTVLMAVTNLLFSWLALTGRDLTMLTVVISADNVTVGLAGSAFLAYLASLTSSAYTATQYALFSSLMSLPGKFMGGFSGFLVDHVGYAAFFVYTAAIGIPSMLLALYLLRQEKATAASAS